MRVLPALLLLVSVAGCAAPAPAVVRPPSATPAVETPPADPLVRLAAAEVVDVTPISPPPVPELRIERRSVFERAGAVEWTLANGLTVVYVHDPRAEAYGARVVTPAGWMTLPPASGAPYAALSAVQWGPLTARVGPTERVARGEAASLVDLVEAVADLLTERPDAAEAPPTVSQAEALRLAEEAFEPSDRVTVFLLGPREREWVEPLVAAVLGGLRSGRDAFPPATSDAPVSAASVRGGWDDLPSVLVLDRALSDRAGRLGGEADVLFDAAAGRIVVQSDVPAAALFEPFADDVLRRFRDEAAVAAASTAGRLDAFVYLYSLPGTFRPVRDPYDAVRLAGHIARTPPSAVADLLAQLSGAR